MKTVFLLFLTVLMISCRKSSETKEEQRLADSLAIEDSLREVRDANATGSPDANAFAEFGTTNGGVNLRLRDSKGQINMAALGTANDTLTRELTLVTDEHQGATVIEYKYDDINLTYFQPKGSNEAWLQMVEIKGGNWSTARGIKVGDSLADLKSMYPSISEWDDKDRLYSYKYGVDDSVVLFGIADEKVSRIKIEYNIP